MLGSGSEATQVMFLHIRRTTGTLFIVLLVFQSSGSCLGDDTSFFESKIRPLLVKRCYPCHGADKEPSGGLRLDSKPGWETGGDSGPALIPGEAEKSLLIQAVRWRDSELKMPPKDAGRKLKEAEIADLVVWVNAGAYDPRQTVPISTQSKAWAEVFEERRNWWSLQPLKVATVPALHDPEWNTPVDRFLYHQMQKRDITPSALANPETLIRRATLFLTGLPPTAEESAAFVQESRSDRSAAYAALVDRLLDSPHFGERFARHWLDVVRFTETHGNEWNYDVAYAWRYRDYVIRALNADVPYDQFVREHIAGDLLDQPRSNATGGFNESAIGTAFYRFGEVNHDSCVQFAAIGYDIVDNQLDTLTKAFQATTVACARCHDHKIDAVSMEDYHAVLGVLRSSRSVQRTLDSPEVNRDAIVTLRKLKKELRVELAAVWRADARAVGAAKLHALTETCKDKAPPPSSPLQAWFVACQPDTQSIAQTWTKLATDHAKELLERSEFNETKFTTLADFRFGIPEGWFTDGMGLRDGGGASGDFAVAHEGDPAVTALLPAGVFTFALSDKLNGALRSPTLRRTHGKISFEVVGGRFSLARLVFNNCQLNYNHQHSLHHEAWSWVTVDFPQHTDVLRPYAELLTFWDNPKFPDPLGTLGKDTENQRDQYVVHAKNPRTWWGVRRIVMHDEAQTPKEELSHLDRLYAGAAPSSADEAAARYAAIAGDAVEAFAANRAGDDDVRWLDWLLKSGLVSNKSNATPRLTELIVKYRQVEGQLALPTTIPGMADEGVGFEQPLLARGDHNKPGEPVTRGYLKSLMPAGFTLNPRGSGRRELAHLIASPENPLTARVMANRIWQWVFGNGLVATPDDFGRHGEAPSHPELLDELAARFVTDGWSMKKLVRSLVLSRAFQSESAPTAESRLRDPKNVLLSHYSARRAEAEVIRDSILAVSGRLDARLYGPSVNPYRNQADPDKRLFAGPLDGDGRRSIYLKFQLMEAPHFLRAFNLPGGKVTQGQRDTSNVPAQSLAMLNDPFVLSMADHWAGRLVVDGRGTIASRTDAMFGSALGRAPSSAERERFIATVHALASTHGVAEADILATRAVWKDAAHAMFNLKEFIFIP